MPSNLDPSPGAGAVLRDSILQLLARPQAPSKRWWSIADLLEQLLQPPVPPASKDYKTAEVLDNYLRAVASLWFQSSHRRSSNSLRRFVDLDQTTQL